MADVVSTAPCPGRVQLAAGPLGIPSRDPLPVPLVAAAAPDSNALAPAMVGGASPEATPTDPRSDAAVGGATAGRLLLVPVIFEEEVGVVVGGGVCFFKRMRSSIASLLFLRRGSCGVGEELFSRDGCFPPSSALTVSESAASTTSGSAKERINRNSNSYSSHLCIKRLLIYMYNIGSKNRPH